MTLNGMIGRALATFTNGGPQAAFAYAFAVGFGFGVGVLSAGALFDLLPSPLAP